jgi:hypothetical protein
MIARIPLHATKRDLEIVSRANPGRQIELEADGSLVMSPTGSGTPGALGVRFRYGLRDAGQSRARAGRRVDLERPPGQSDPGAARRLRTDRSDFIVEVVGKSDRRSTVDDPYTRESFACGTRPNDLAFDIEANYAIE